MLNAQSLTRARGFLQPSGCRASCSRAVPWPGLEGTWSQSPPVCEGGVGSWETPLQPLAGMEQGFPSRDPSGAGKGAEGAHAGGSSLWEGRDQAEGWGRRMGMGP